MTDQELIERLEHLNGPLDQIVDLVMRLDERVDKRFERVEKRLDDLEKRSDENVELTRAVETALLKEYRKWAISFESRFKANEVLIGGFNERLIALEERGGNIERRSENGRR